MSGGKKNKQKYANLEATNKKIYKGIYNLQEHLQRAFTKMKCNIRLEYKLKYRWIQRKNNLATKKWKEKNQKLAKKLS